MSETVRTRFAPSPTGYLHIGGARTALFNYLLARRLGGTFVLRIEDTDQTRNIGGAEQKLLEDLRWLGLDWDEGPQAGGNHGPYYQSQRIERYREIAQRLLDEGRAYYAFETRDELAALRKAAEEQTGGFLYPRPNAFPSAADAARARNEGRPVVVRFKMSGHTHVINDEILGTVEVKPEELDDFIILKSDRWPTYNFACVVDDEQMRITHVLRGQEHLINTARQLDVQKALSFSDRLYYHLPIILNTSGSKMSKREKDKVVRDAVREALDTGALPENELIELSDCGDAGAFKRWRKKKTQLDAHGLLRLAEALHVELPEIDIHDFRTSGYLPEVIVNFIALLGWSAGDDREKYTLDELAAVFSAERIGKTSARFDRDKLLSFNTDALNEAGMDRKLAGFREYLAANADSRFRGLDDDMLAKLIEINAGFRIYADIERKAGAIFAPDEQLVYDPAAIKKVLLKGERAGVAALEAVRPLLAAVGDWRAGALEAMIRGYCEQNGLKLGKVAQPIRVAVTGSTISPTIFDTLELLGRDKTLARIDRALRHVECQTT